MSTTVKPVQEIPSEVRKAFGPRDGAEGLVTFGATYVYSLEEVHEAQGGLGEAVRLRNTASVLMNGKHCLVKDSPLFLVSTMENRLKWTGQKDASGRSVRDQKPERILRLVATNSEGDFAFRPQIQKMQRGLYPVAIPVTGDSSKAILDYGRKPVQEEGQTASEYKTTLKKWQTGLTRLEVSIPAEDRETVSDFLFSHAFQSGEAKTWRWNSVQLYYTDTDGKRYQSNIREVLSAIEGIFAGAKNPDGSPILPEMFQRAMAVAPMSAVLADVPSTETSGVEVIG